MLPTPELRTRIRKLLNEQIPESGSQSDTNFTDEELDDLLRDSVDIYGAASLGWATKAGLLQGEVEKYTHGQESYDLAPLRDKLTHALAMARHYAGMAKSSGSGSMMLGVARPEVL